MKPFEPDKVAPYANENLRFRKAFVRERLNALKNERLALIAERDEIDKKLTGKATKPAGSDTI